MVIFDRLDIKNDRLDRGKLAPVFYLLELVVAFCALCRLIDRGKTRIISEK